MSGSLIVPFADAIYARLNGDAALTAAAPGGVFASLPQASRTVRPYIVVGSQRDVRDGQGANAMQTEGGKATVIVDVFSDFHGPEEAQDIQALIRGLLHRQSLTAPGVTVMAGSLVCEEERVFSDFDPDMPQRSGYHGVQVFTGLVEAQ